MSDATTAKAGAAGPTPPQLAINAQYIKDFSFENPNAPQSFNLAPGVQPQISVNVDVQARGVADSLFEVSLRINAEAKSGDKTAFVIELVYAGLFTLHNVPAEHMEAVCLIECPRLIFPFARRIVADATRDGGFPPLMLDPIDFAEIFRRARAQAQNQPQHTPGHA